MVYLAFARMIWALPVWTPDRFVVAVALAAYCLRALLHKERRLAIRHGDVFACYRAHIPYALPRLRRRGGESGRA